MGLENFIKSKIKSKKEDYERESRFKRELKEKTNIARHEAYQKGAIARAKAQGYKQGKEGRSTGVMGAIESFGKFGQGMGQGLSTWGDDFDILGPPRKRRQVNKGSGKTITIRIKDDSEKSQRRKIRRQNDFPF
ncbi:MAG: hypothetical protein WC325_13575 [Candidatus Bathyarchaeia archaeon]|jgi:hypothetical protein